MSSYSIPSESVFTEQEYSVSRRVRSIAYIESCLATPEVMEKVMERLNSTCITGETIPFMFDRGDGWADYGFAAHQCFVDCFKLIRIQDSPIQKELGDCLTGLMLGYGVDEIARFYNAVSR